MNCTSDSGKVLLPAYDTYLVGMSESYWPNYCAVRNTRSWTKHSHDMRVRLASSPSHAVKNVGETAIPQSDE